jgi:hypothetical protein
MRRRGLVFKRHGLHDRGIGHGDRIHGIVRRERLGFFCQ